jgi:hypothetical protein
MQSTIWTLLEPDIKNGMQSTIWTLLEPDIQNGMQSTVLTTTETRQSKWNAKHHLNFYLNQTHKMERKAPFEHY